MNKRRRHTAKQRARAQKRIVAETQRRLRNLVPVQNEYRGWGSTPYSEARAWREAIVGSCFVRTGSMLERRR